jgi:pimeloyl-ACP methyl ester carboxylesterase
MSRPPTFDPPPGAVARTLHTSRGDFAAVEAPAAGRRGHIGTVLLLPGYTGSKEDFISLHEPLAAAGFRSVAVDGRGQFETGGPDDEAAYARDELALDVLAQAEAVGEPVHLLGHSLGGLIARAAVLRDPGPFRSLTLVSFGPAEISPPQQQRVKLLRDLLATQSLAEIWDLMERLQDPQAAEVTPTDGAPDIAVHLRRRWLATRPAQLLATGRLLCTEPDRTAQLAALGLRTHVLSGETDGAWPVPGMDAMAQCLRAHRTVVPGADHSPNTDRPALTAAALTTFWGGCPAD